MIRAQNPNPHSPSDAGDGLGGSSGSSGRSGGRRGVVVKIVDFGLAVAHSAAGDDGRPGSTREQGREQSVGSDGARRGAGGAYHRGRRHTEGVGTATYAAPEQAAGAGGYDGRADVFSLGCGWPACLAHMHMPA